MSDKKRKTDIVIESEKKNINKTGYNEEPAKYMANPRRGFWSSLCKLLNKKESP